MHKDPAVLARDLLQDGPQQKLVDDIVEQSLDVGTPEPNRTSSTAVTSRLRHREPIYRVCSRKSLPERLRRDPAQSVV